MKRLLVVAVVASSVGLGGCGGSAEDEDAEWVAENAGADTAVVESEGDAEVVAAEPVTETVTESKAEIPADSYDAPSQMSTNYGTGEVNHYTVKKNDTLMKIAFEVYGDITRWRDIFDMNRDKLKNANMIMAGTKIKYEKPVQEPDVGHNGEPYLIKSGDTLGSIADDVYAQRSKWKKIYENNKDLIRDPNRIYAGFYIYYQITEEERRRVDEIKGRRNQRLGGMPSAETFGPTTVGSVGGGLNDLAAPDDGEVVEQDRVPTATQ